MTLACPQCSVRRRLKAIANFTVRDPGGVTGEEGEGNGRDDQGDSEECGGGRGGKGGYRFVDLWDMSIGVW